MYNVCDGVPVQVKFRNADYDTFVSVQYINRRVSVSDSTNIHVPLSV